MQAPALQVWPNAHDSVTAPRVPVAEQLCTSLPTQVGALGTHCTQPSVLSQVIAESQVVFGTNTPLALHWLTTLPTQLCVPGAHPPPSGVPSSLVIADEQLVISPKARAPSAAQPERDLVSLRSRSRRAMVIPLGK